MSTAFLCKGKQSGSVFNVYSGHPCIIPSSVWASLIILSCPIIAVYGFGDLSHRAICSHSIDAEIRSVGQEATGTHMLSGRSEGASYELLSLHAGQLDQTEKRR